MNAKRAGACLDEAINNVVYRGSLAEFRDVFLHGRAADADKGITALSGIEDITGIERKTKPVLKDGKPVVKDGVEASVYDETESDYFKRVVAEKGGEATQFQSVADEIAAAIAFDASARERKAPAGPKKLAAKYVTTAKAILASGNFAKAQARFAQYSTPWPEFTGDAEKDATALGWAIKANQEAIERSQLDQLV